VILSCSAACPPSKVSAWTVSHRTMAESSTSLTSFSWLSESFEELFSRLIYFLRVFTWFFLINAIIFRLVLLVFLIYWCLYIIWIFFNRYPFFGVHDFFLAILFLLFRNF
jgi:hypothetical protein